MPNDPIRSEELADTKVLIGAALTVAKDGITSALADKAAQASTQAAALIEPGDQRHIPHPWGNFKNRVLWTYNYLVTPGDMNLNHSPHPVDTTMQLHAALVTKTTDTLTEKGLVEGVRLTSAAVATIAVASADPFRKLCVAESIADVANTAETLHHKPDISWDDYAHLLGKPFSGICVRALNSYVSIAAENTRAGVITSFRSRLELWMNPLVDAATSANDFDLRDVRKKKMSIYLGVTPDNLERMAPLLNLFFQQLIDLNTRELPSQNKALKYSCLLLMDEFTSIGKIGVLSKGISYIAGYNLRMLPIIQSPRQLVEVYGEDAAQTFTTNHALNIIFPPKASETQTAKDISEWLGNQTVKTVSKSRSANFFKTDGNTNSTSEQSRALMLPQEITSLGQGKELVIMENVRPILAEKVVYFNDPEFTRRLKMVSKSLRALGFKKPARHQMDEAIRKGELAAKVPLLDLEEHNRQNAAHEMVTLSAPKGNAPALKPLDQVDFSSIKKPAPGEMDEAALKAYADDLCRAMGMNV